MIKFAISHPDLLYKCQVTSLRIYGVINPMQNAAILRKNRDSAFNDKLYVFPITKRAVFCRGYEPWALDKLLADGYAEDDILTEHEISHDTSIPQFWYERGGRQHRYYPDIFIRSKDIIIEVKSDYTFRLDPELQRLKAEAVLLQLIWFETWVFDRKKRLTVY